MIPNGSPTGRLIVGGSSEHPDLVALEQAGRDGAAAGTGGAGVRTGDGDEGDGLAAGRAVGERGRIPLGTRVDVALHRTIPIARDPEFGGDNGRGG